MVFTFILRRIVGTEESSITLLVTKRQRIVRIRKWSINFIFDDIVIEERLPFLSEQYGEDFNGFFYNSVTIVEDFS